MKEFEEYIEGLKIGNKSKFTIATYSKDINKLLNFFNIQYAKDIEKLVQSDYVKFVGSLESLSPASKNGAIRSINAFMSWLNESGYISENTFSKTHFGKRRFIKTEKKVPFALSDDDCVAMINAANNIQDKFMITLMLMTAIRAGEVCNIEMNDISVNDNECKITVRGKGKKQRNIFLQDDLKNLMAEYISSRKTNSKYLLYGTRGILRDACSKLSTTSVNSRVKQIGKLANLPEEKLNKLHAHITRSTGITRIIRTEGVAVAQLIAGHENILTTMRYNALNEQDAKNAMLHQNSLLKG
jgi:integrase/recombinase XerD